MTPTADRPVRDTVAGTLVERAPAAMRPYLRLARYDRPVGFWLLGLPCAMGLALARVSGGWGWGDLGLLALLAVGAVAMRGAGCTYNDIVDKDLDARVDRTANRPLPAGTVSVRAAWGFLGLQLVVGLLVLAAIPRAAQLTALAAIPIIAAYPFMKRVTWFPQAWLGLAMNWGMLVAYAAARGEITTPAFLLFAGLWAWTFGYDTIYAHQDKEDDALVGVKSTARFFAEHSRLAIAVSYTLTTLLAAAAAVEAAGPTLERVMGVIAALVFAALLARQVSHVDFDDDASTLLHFKRNVRAGFAYAAALAALPALAAL